MSITGGSCDFPQYYRYHGPALIISTAINRYIYVIVKERFNSEVGAYYEKSEIVESASKLNHELIRETADLVGLTHGFDVSIMTDIPTSGSGLGSSSALTVGLLHAFSVYSGRNVSNQWLAENACKIEIDLLKKPIGKQDQYIAAYGGFRAFSFLKVEHDYDIDEVVPLKINLSNNLKRELESNLMLYFTNNTRNASDILTEQKNNIKDKLLELDKINDISRNLYKELVIHCTIDNVGDALLNSWNVKKQLASNINNSEIETILGKAMNAGATGGKVSGAGGGGFVLVFCKPESQSAVRKTLSDYYEFPFRFEEHGSKIILNLPIQTIK